MMTDKSMARTAQEGDSKAGKTIWDRPPDATPPPTFGAVLLSPHWGPSPAGETSTNSTSLPPTGGKRCPLTLPREQRSKCFHTCFLRDTPLSLKQTGQVCGDKLGTRQAQARCSALSSSLEGPGSLGSSLCEPSGLPSPPCPGLCLAASYPLGKD